MKIKNLQLIKSNIRQFDEQKHKINLSQCNNSNIKILYGIKNNSNLDRVVVKSFIILFLYSRILI